MLRKLNIQKKEAALSITMFIAAGFLGVFLSTFDIGAHAIFMDQFSLLRGGAGKFLSLAYVASGGIGVIFFFFYSLLYKRISTKSFYFINLLTILVCGALYFDFTILKPPFWHHLITNMLKLFIANRAYTPEDAIAFVTLVFMFPFNLMALLNFNRYIRNIFHPEQRRRIYPFIEFGFILGMIGGSYSVIGVLLYYQDYNAMVPIITLSSILFLFILQLPQNLIHRAGKVFNHKKQHFIPVKTSIFMMFSSKYTSVLFFFTLISAIIGFLIHFCFIILTRASFPHIIGMSKFYGLFIGTMYIFILGTKKFLVKRILYSYDSPYSVILVPVAMGLILLTTLVINLVLGNSTALARFTFLFILITMNRIVYETGKYTIQIPSLRTLFKTLDIRYLQIIYPRIEGTLVMLGMFVAGVIILGLSYLNLFSLQIIIILSFVLTPLWLFFGVRLIKTYKRALQDSYKKMRMIRNLEHQTDSYNEQIRRILIGDDPLKVINALNLSSRIEPLSYENSLRRTLANPEPVIQQYVLQCIEKESLLDLLPDLKQINPSSEEMKVALSGLIEKFEKKLHQIHQGNDIQTLVRSLSVNDRKFAAEIIGARRDPTYTSVLVNLSREFEPEVKFAAIKAITHILDADHSYILIEFLSSPQFHAYAFEALVEIGEPALEYLERLFLDPGTDDKILARAVRIYGKIGTTKAIELLLGKLENQSRRVTEQTILALREAKFQATSLNVHRILNIIVRLINTLGWNLLVYTSLQKKSIYSDLKTAFANEIDLNHNLLFELLGLAYNPHAMQEIRTLIDRGSQEDISHAIELLDHFVYEDIKPILLPVIENIPNEERVKKLQYYFPIESMTKEEIVSSILTRDYNLLSYYPRICAMNLALRMKNIETNQELIANLFHPNKLLREVAALVVFRKNPEIFASVLERLDPHIQTELKESIAILDKKENMLTIDKFNVLRKTAGLSELGEEILIELAKSFEEVKFKKDQQIDLKTKANSYALFLVLEGNMYFNDIKSETIVNEQYQLFYSQILVNAGIDTLHFSSDSVLLRINHDTVESLLFDYTEMASCMLSCVEQFKMAG